MIRAALDDALGGPGWHCALFGVHLDDLAVHHHQHACQEKRLEEIFAPQKKSRDKIPSALQRTFDGPVSDHAPPQPRKLKAAALTETFLTARSKASYTAALHIGNKVASLALAFLAESH
jgi:hypothetical protein